MAIRKITSAEEMERRTKRRNLILTIILVGVMVLSTFGTGLYMFGGSNSGDNSNSNQNKVNYNGYEFIESNDLWYFTIGEMNFILNSNPNELPKTYINVTNSMSSYQNVPLYIYSEEEYLGQTIYNDFYQIAQRTQDACLASDANKTICEGKPIKSCSDNFIIIKEASENKIVQENKCVFIYGKRDEIEKITDVFVLKMLGLYTE